MRVGHNSGMSHEASGSGRDVGRILSYVGGWLGVAAMLVLAPFFLATGLMAPLWGVVLVMAIWLALLALAVLAIRRRRPLLALLAPVVAAGLWWLVLTLGERLLGWTA